MVQYYLADASDTDFDFLYELKKVSYKNYIEQTWGWDDAFQIKFHKENFATGNTKIILAGNRQIGSVDVKEGDTNIFISSLYLLPAFQSKGIGTQIINDLIKKAAIKNKRLELEVLQVNIRAQKLYGRLGFTKTTRDKTKYFMFKDAENNPEKSKAANLQFIPFEAVYADDFASLNKAWLQKYFEIEPIDEAIFANPTGYIIDKGGYIFFAQIGDAIVGTFALIKINEGVFELSKMAVTEECQGQKIGNKMVEFSLSKSRELHAEKVILYSNTSLKPAIHLYKKYGFKEVPLGAVEYRRANIKMEIEIK